MVLLSTVRCMLTAGRFYGSTLHDVRCMLHADFVRDGSIRVSYLLPQMPLFAVSSAPPFNETNAPRMPPAKFIVLIKTLTCLPV